MDAPIKLTLARKDYQLKQILQLQKANLIESIDADTASSQGFVTATHDLTLLKAMAATAAPVIAIRERTVLGYCLAMDRSFSTDVSALTFLIDRMDGAMHRGAMLGESAYLVMGQICVAEEARGKKLPDRMYKYLRACYHLRYTYCVTAVDARNTRSFRVHERIGFDVLDRFTSADGRDWILLIWNWREGMDGFE